MNKTKIQPYLNNYALEGQNTILCSLEDLKLNDQIIRLIVHKVTISKDNIELELNKNITIKILENLAYNKEIPINIQDTEFIIIKKDIKIVSTPSHGNKLIIGDEVEFNSTLINAIIKGFYYYKLWEEEKLSPEQKKSTYIYRLMNLRFLPPNIVEDVLNGRQAAEITVKKLYEFAKL